MNVELGSKDLELVFRGLMVLPWVEVNHLITRLQNIEKNHRINLEYEQKKLAYQQAEQPVETKLKKAKYGLKKDGTPRAKPGRKPA